MDSLHMKMKRIADARRNDSDKLYSEQSLKRLLKIISTKIQTSFIGAISEFEKAFGTLWGHDLDESVLTPQQAKFRELWESTRTNILNNGNNQLRAAQNELRQYTVVWNRYQSTFSVKPEEV